MKIKKLFGRKVEIETPVKAGICNTTEHFNLVSIELRDMTDKMLLDNQKLINRITNQNAAF